MTIITNQIDRNSNTPMSADVHASTCSGYIAVEILNWTPQMFYELPVIKINVYKKQAGVDCKYKVYERLIRTYASNGVSQNAIRICTSVRNIPEFCTIAVTPIFDNNAVSARNELIKNGIETGTMWDTPTQIFPITVGFEET